MISLRLASLDDADFLRALRNDPEMRKNSFHSAKVGKAEHLRWLNTTLRDELRLYVAETIRGGEYVASSVGTGRLDFDGTQVEVTIEIAPEFRGLGYGGQLVSALVREARTWQPSTPLIAHVKAFNTPSLRAFLRAGFSARGTRAMELELR